MINALIFRLFVEFAKIGKPFTIGCLSSILEILALAARLNFRGLLEVCRCTLTE